MSIICWYPLSRTLQQYTTAGVLTWVMSTDNNMKSYVYKGKCCKNVCNHLYRYGDKSDDNKKWLKTLMKNEAYSHEFKCKIQLSLVNLSSNYLVYIHYDLLVFVSKGVMDLLGAKNSSEILWYAQHLNKLQRRSLLYFFKTI